LARFGSFRSFFILPGHTSGQLAVSAASTSGLSNLNWRKPTHCLIQPNTFSITRQALIDLAYPAWRVVRPSMAE
jgi:hypothetical protein